jgi:hypothetical protein
MLLFANGTLEYNYTTKACFDENGNPKIDKNPNGSVRCSYQIVKSNRNTIVIDGVMQLIEMTINVDANSVEGDFNPTHITLTADNGMTKQYSVKRVEHYPLTKSYCLWV